MNEPRSVCPKPCPSCRHGLLLCYYSLGWPTVCSSVHTLLSRCLTNQSLRRNAHIPLRDLPPLMSARIAAAFAFLHPRGRSFLDWLHYAVHLPRRATFSTPCARSLNPRGIARFRSPALSPAASFLYSYE